MHSLSTWQKWHQYGRIPWKFIVNFIIVALTTTLVSLGFSPSILTFQQQQQQQNKKKDYNAKC